MLGVFKKKLKPKRQSRRTKATNLQAVAPNSLDIPQTDNGAGSSKKPLENEDRINHDTLSENTCYPLSPNICVEGGRIEFIKIPQTDLQIENYEEKLKNLEQLLAEERLKNEVERLAISKLQRQNAKLETQVKNLEQDKSQTEEMYIKDEEKMKATILMLQNDCRKLEEGVRTLLPYKSHADQLKSEKMSISLAYEGKLQQYHLKLTSLLADNEAFKQKVQAYESKEAGYEACLDQVASQVVKALISQKALKEEIATLRARIRDLEQQNLSLTSLICCQHQHSAKTPTESCKPAEACPGLHTRPQNLNLNGKVAECLVSNCVDPSESSHLHSELVAVKLGQFNARLNSLVSAKICDHVNQVNTKQHTKTECMLEEYQLIDKHEDTRRSVSCEPSAPDLSCLSPEKRRTDITPESLFTNLPPETTNSTQSTPKHTEICKITTTPNGTKFPECNLIEMTDSELAKISFCEIPAKDEGYNTLTSEILPDFDTSLHTDITRLLPDLAEESEASFDFSKIQPLRHSYPPLNTKIKFQHLLNYFSDSQLFLRFPDLNPGSVIRFSDFWDYEPGFDIDSSHSNFEFGGSESLWNIEELMKSERPLSLTPSLTPSTTSSDSDQSNSLSDGPHENSSNVDFTNDYYCLVKVGSVKSLASSPQIQSECSVVLCELTLEEKSHLPQECMPLLIDTDDISDSLNIESIEDCTLNQIEENKNDEEEDELDLLDHLSDSPSPSTNESDSNKSSSDLDLSPSELEFFTVTDLKKQKRYKTRNYFTTDYPGRQETSNLQRRGKSKSESQLNTHKTINKKRPNSECFHNKSQYSIHKSYYNNFVKFSPKKSSISNEELKITSTSSRVQSEKDILEIVKDNLKLNSLDRLKMTTTTTTTQIAQENGSEEASSSSKTVTEISTCFEETQVEQTSDNNIKLLLQNDVLDFDCMKSDGADFTSDSKKIIETLNRMIQKSSNSSEEQLNRNSIEFKEGIPTSWVHFEKQTNFSDPKERANLLDRMLATAPSSEESENDDFKDYQHLLKLHRRRRHRKAYMHHRGFLRSAAGCSRASIVGQRGLFTRYGEAEKQAVASFDFLFEVEDNELLEEEE